MNVQYDYNSVKSALKLLGITKNDTLFTHSNIGFFGIPAEGKSIDIACEIIFKALRDVIGDKGTIVVPTFTYSFPESKTFNYDEPSKSCGIFSEYVRKLKDSIRSEDPSYSVSANGYKAKLLTNNINQNSFGSDSFFSRFLEEDGKICNFNMDAGSTFVHYVERVLKVPYRYDKTFKGVFKKNNFEETRENTIWVRYLKYKETEANFSVLNEISRNKRLFLTSKLGRGFIGCISAKNTMKIINETIASRPWFLTKFETLGKIPKLPFDI